MANVSDILKSVEEQEAKLKTTDVHKGVELETDCGNLLAIDVNPLNFKELRSNKDEYLKSLCRDNTQLLLNRIWELPLERVEDCIVAQLPDPQTRLPREKPIPDKKKLTRWEEYAQTKNIQNRKRERKVWDEEEKKWLPRWGYKKANDMSQNWVLEVPESADPYEDQFAKLNKEKKERVAKNELQRLRNIARNMKGKVPGVGLTPTANPEKDQLSRALQVAHKSTASVGQFTDRLSREKPTKGAGKKRKFESNTGDMSVEKKRGLDILQRITNKKPILDSTKAANQLMHQDEKKRAANKASKPGKAGSGGKKKKGGTKGGGGGFAVVGKKKGPAKKGGFGKKSVGKGKMAGGAKKGKGKR